MGRGRQKAKHTKVARELKYFSPNTDYSALERELGQPGDNAEPVYEDKWADLYEDGEDDGEAEETDPLADLGETGETVEELEGIIELESPDEVAEQEGDVDTDGSEDER
ncbi:MAG: hypothetical protein RLZZ626_415 [Actinomycetota bacterium]|jgi:hypothetical protein